MIVAAPQLAGTLGAGTPNSRRGEVTDIDGMTFIPIVAATLGGGGEVRRGWSPDTDRMTFIPTTAPTIFAAYGTKWNGNAGVATGQIIVPALTRKMVKGTGGPAGNECPNPIAFHATQEPINGPVVPCLGENASMGISGRSGVRRLTPTECERLQGLPDGWTLPGSDSKRYAALGDAVTANVAEWIGRRLNDAKR